ncbi:MAG: hypothetical protein OXF22_11205 [Anaerolineaceae bacterium]|nr:hypothetical protein [Anaerolineaceae bacterium]
MKRAESSKRFRWSSLGGWVLLLAPWLALGAGFAAMTRTQQAALRDWLWSVLVLCPLILCIFPLYLLLLALGWVALPKAAAQRRKGMIQLRGYGLDLQDRLRAMQDQLPEPPAAIPLDRSQESQPDE